MRFNANLNISLSLIIGKYLIDLEFNPLYWRLIHKLTKDKGLMITQLGPFCIYIIDDEKSSKWLDSLLNKGDKCDNDDSLETEEIK